MPSSIVRHDLSLGDLDPNNRLGEFDQFQNPGQINNSTLHQRVIVAGASPLRHR